MEIQQAPNPDLKRKQRLHLTWDWKSGCLTIVCHWMWDYYLDKSKDLIAYKGVSSVSGFSGKYVNYADVSNQGLDISLSGTIIKNKDWRWTAAFNMGDMSKTR